jgi:hypothetical protein
MAFSLETDYYVDKKDIVITITIGDAQLGASILKLNGKEITRGDDIKDFVIGKGEKIKNKSLLIKSIVTDVNDKTNHTSITYKFKGGKLDCEYYLDGTVASEGDSIIYRATFNFV